MSGTLKKIKDIKKMSNDHIKELIKMTKNLKMDYENEMNNVRKEMIKKISSDYKLNYNELIKKYINKNTKNEETETEINDKEIIIDETEDLIDSEDEYINTDKEKILYKYVYNGVEYYIDTKENNASVYNKNNEEIGKFNNGKVELYK